MKYKNAGIAIGEHVRYLESVRASIQGYRNQAGGADAADHFRILQTVWREDGNPVAAL